MAMSWARSCLSGASEERPEFKNSWTSVENKFPAHKALSDQPRHLWHHRETISKLSPLDLSTIHRILGTKLAFAKANFESQILDPLRLLFIRKRPVQIDHS